MSKREQRLHRQAEKLEKQKNRQIRQGFEPSPSRVPKGEPRTFSEQTVTFSFDRVDFAWQWGDDGQQHYCVATLLKTLKDIEGKQWSEITRDKHDHCQKLTSLEPEAQDRLKAIGLAEFEVLFRLRVTPRRRVWGVKSGETFVVVWWDPEHQVYITDDRRTNNSRARCKLRNQNTDT